MAKEITMEVIKEYGNVGKRYKLKAISWNKAEAKYDLRNWYVDRDGNEKYSKGITMSSAELKELRDLLNKIDL